MCAKYVYVHSIRMSAIAVSVVHTDEYDRQRTESLLRARRFFLLSSVFGLAWLCLLFAIQVRPPMCFFSTIIHIASSTKECLLSKTSYAFAKPESVPSNTQIHGRGFETNLSSQALLRMIYVECYFINLLH